MVGKEQRRNLLDIGYVIRRLRQDKNWTLGQLATYSGIGKSYLSRIERGQHPNVSAKKIGKIARALNVEPSYLYEQAGWYESKRNPAAFPPDIQSLADLVNSYPEGPYKDVLEYIIRCIAKAATDLLAGLDNDALKNMRGIAESITDGPTTEL